MLLLLDMNTIIPYLSIMLFTALFSFSGTAFAGPNPCNQSNISYLSSATLALSSTAQNSAQFNMAGKAGDDMNCPYVMNIYVSPSSSVSMSNYSFQVTAGTQALTGPYNFTNKQVNGLNSGSTYYAIGCLVSASSQSVCSSVISFATQPASNTGGGGGSSGSSSGGYYYPNQNYTNYGYGYTNYNYANCCSGTTYVPTSTNRYNSYATDSTSHSREGRGSYYSTEGYIMDENEYYYRYMSNNNNATYQNYRTVDSATQVVNNNGSIGAYGSPENYQYVSTGYYRGNGGDLRVYDRPFDLVGLSNHIRGGVARSYETTYWAGGAVWPIIIVLIVLVLGFGAYRIGRESTR